MGGGRVIYHGGVPGCTVSTEDLKFKWVSFICFDCQYIIQAEALLCKLPFSQSISLIQSTFHETWMMSAYLQQAFTSLPHSAQSKHDLPHIDNNPSDVSSRRCCISNLWFCYQGTNVSSQRLQGHVWRRGNIGGRRYKMNFKKNKKIIILSLYWRDLHSFVCLNWEGTFQGKERNISTFQRQ